MAASMTRCALQRIIRSNFRETYCRQKRWLKFRKEDNQYVPKVVPYQTFPNQSLEERYPEVEISAEEYKYVERLFPSKTVPSPPEHKTYPTPSGWFPPDSPAQLSTFILSYCNITPLARITEKNEETGQQYYVRRSKNHMLPVYVDVHPISRQVTTLVRHVVGDIKLLDSDIRAHLKEKIGRDIDSQVHEVAMYLRYRGDRADIIAKFLLYKGF